MTRRVIWVAFLLLLPASMALSEPLAQYSAHPERATLVLGGSLSPPTVSHLSLMADVLVGQEFSEGIFFVANPYKPGAAPGAVSLHLTRVAVENFHEVLEKRGIPFSDFRVVGPGKVVWTSPAGRPLLLEVSDRAIVSGTKDSIDSFRHLHAKVGDARDLWWLAGGDAAASMPKWGSWWKEMFEHANLVFVGRKSVKGEATIDSRKPDPLSGFYPKDFLESYRYSKLGGIHRYLARDARGPGIFVLENDAYGDSSTEARALLGAGKHADAQRMLTPSVYRAILEQGYYGTAGCLKAVEGLGL